MSTSTEERTLHALLWTGRVVGCFFVILGLLVFSSSFETGQIWLAAFAVLGVGGGLIYIFGLERPRHPSSRWARVLGWLMMGGLSVLPSSLMFAPVVLVLLALPALFLRSRRPQEPSLRPS